MWDTDDCGPEHGNNTSKYGAINRAGGGGLHFLMIFFLSVSKINTFEKLTGKYLVES